MGGKKVIVRYQMDGAGPHKDKELNSYLAEAFDDRGWILKFQPPNSPLTNVKDACIFPALSKHVTQHQGLKNGSLVYTPDELWEAVMDCVDDFSSATIARAYVGHHQMVNAIAHCRGGDDFVKARGGLSVGVRKHCAPICTEDGIPLGVKIVEELDEVDTSSMWKYPKPVITDFEHNTLNQQELRVIAENLPRDEEDWVEFAATYYCKETNGENH